MYINTLRRPHTERSLKSTARISRKRSISEARRSDRMQHNETSTKYPESPVGTGGPRRVTDSSMKDNATEPYRAGHLETDTKVEPIHCVNHNTDENEPASGDTAVPIGNKKNTKLSFKPDPSIGGPFR